MDEMIDQVIGSIEQLSADIDMIQQPRSDFALRHFVAGQHDLPGRQRAQVVLELQVKLFGIKRAKVQREKINLQIDKQKRQFETGDFMAQREAQLEIESLQVDMAELELGLVGAIREANTLLAILATMPTYTREQFEEEEAEYWKRRLTRQYVVGARDIGGNLDAALQTLTTPGEPKPPIGTFDDVTALLNQPPA